MVINYNYSTWYIYYVSPCVGPSYYYTSTAMPGPEGGQCVGETHCSLDAHLTVQDYNKGDYVA